MDLLTLGSSPFPLPLSSLASRDELRAWLTRLFISIVSPGKFQLRPNLVKLPNTLVVLVGLLDELKKNRLSKPLACRLHAIYLERRTCHGPNGLSRHSSAPCFGTLKRQGSCAPHSDGPVACRSGGYTCVLVGGASICSPDMPKGFAAKIDDIGCYKSRIEANMLFSHPMFKLPENDAIISLLLYKDIKDLGGKHVNYFLETSFPTVVDGNTHPVPGSFHVLTSPDHCDLVKGQVRWRMSKMKMAKMRREKWTIVAWRTDFWAQSMWQFLNLVLYDHLT
jgi:hypothetical protein